MIRHLLRGGTAVLSIVLVAGGALLLQREAGQGWLCLLTGVAGLLVVDTTAVQRPSRVVWSRQMKEATSDDLGGVWQAHPLTPGGLHVAAALLLVGAGLAPTSVTAPSLQSSFLTYEELMSYDVKERREVFASLPAENRLVLITVHLRRWVAINRARLTDEQREIVEEWLRFLTADIFRRQLSPEVRRAFEDLSNRTDAVFDQSDVTNAFTFDGAYIPDTVPS